MQRRSSDYSDGTDHSLKTRPLLRLSVDQGHGARSSATATPPATDYDQASQSQIASTSVAGSNSGRLSSSHNPHQSNNNNNNNSSSVVSPRSRNPSAVRTSFSSFASVSHASPTPAPSSPKPTAAMMPLALRQLSYEASPETSPRTRHMRLRSPWSISILALSTALTSVFFLLFITHSFVNRPVGVDGCQVPVMSPTYLRMVGFDAEHTRFASKYNLYLYREQGVDYYSEENIGVGARLTK